MENDETDKNRTAVPAPDLESDISNAAFSTHGIKTLDTPVNIRIISYRKSRHDPDGISAKAAIDAFVRTGILADDSTEQVKKVTFESRKSKEEKTIIWITEANNAEQD